MPISTLTTKGQVTIPRELRDQLRLQAGDKIEFRLEKNGTVTMTPVSASSHDVFASLARYGKKKPIPAEEMHRRLRNAFKRGRV